MKPRRLNLRVFGMMDLMAAAFGDKADNVLEESEVYKRYTFGDCAHSLINIDDFIECFPKPSQSNALLREVISSTNPAGEDVVDHFVDLVA